MKYPNALVTFARNRIAYTITKCLYNAGINVVAVDWISPTMTGVSKYTYKSAVVSNPFQTPNKFIQDLKNIANRYSCKVIIPSHEEGLIIARYRQELKDFTIPLSDAKTIELAMNKAHLTKLAQQLKIPVPHTLYPDSMEEAFKSIEEFKYPIVIKQRYGHGAKETSYAYNIDEAMSILKKLIEKGNMSPMPLIQKYVNGRGYGVSVLCNKGKLVSAFVHKRLREVPWTGGTSTARISIHNEKLVSYARTLFENLNFHGVAQAEFKVNEEKGDIYLLEVNPRFWGSLNQAVMSGVNFPLLLYRMAIGDEINEQIDYRDNIVTRWLLGDCRGLLDYLLHSKNRWRILREFLNFWGKDIYYDDFSIRDPLPALIQPIHSIINFIKTGSFNPPDKRTYDERREDEF